MTSPPGRKWLVLVSVGTGSFMAALDGSIVNTVLPVIERTLGGGVAGVEWVVTVYLLVVSGLLLVLGRLGDLYGRRLAYLLGFAGFVVGSGLCGLAPGRATLIAARAVQGIGGAMLFASSPAILTATFPPEQRGRALGLQATMTYLGLTVGPPLGGWLAAALSWRAIFFVNLPVGAAAIALASRSIARDEPSGRPERFDLAGAAVFTAGLIALLLALDRGRTWGWSSPATVATGAAGAALLVAFVAIERRVAAPMLDLALFRERTFSATTASALLNYVSVSTLVFVVPFYLIVARGMSPSHAGIVLTAQSLTMAAVAPASGWASDAIGARVLASGGLAVLAVGLVLCALVGIGADSPAAMAGTLALCGLGTGTFISPNNSALMGSAPRGRQGVAAGMLAEARNVGMVLGVGISGAILDTMTEGGAGAPSGTASGARIALLAAAAVSAAGAVIALLQRRR